MTFDACQVFLRLNMRWYIHRVIAALLLGSLLGPGTRAQSIDTEKRAVVRKSVRVDGLVATYFRPSGDSMSRGLMVLGGSEGGIRSAEFLAYRFAESGFAALAVAYFGIEGLPEKLVDIPLEYFDTAVSWLSQQPFVKPGGITVMGSSRGAELALLVAAYNRTINRVVAYAPSHVVWGPVDPNASPSSSAWTRAGSALAFVPPAGKSDYSTSPYRGTPDFLAALRPTDVVEAAVIPVEKIEGAVLLLSGEDDQLWPSTVMANAIVSRLKEKRHPYRFEHYSFPQAGHVIAPGFDPGMTEFKHPLGIMLALGGTREANRDAQEKAWKKVLEFLVEDHIHGRRD